MIINGLEFIQTCKMYPEKYNVLSNGKQAGYVSIRKGLLKCRVPDGDGKLIYSFYLEECPGDCFTNEEQKEKHLSIVADKINEYLKERQNPKRRIAVIDIKVLIDAIKDLPVDTKVFCNGTYGYLHIDEENKRIIFDDDPLDELYPPNEETLATSAEAEEMMRHPENYKSYSNVDEMIEELEKEE